MEERGAHVDELRRQRLRIAPAERRGVERERWRPLAQGLLLVSEDGGREEIEEAVLTRLGWVRVVEARGGLEDDSASSAAADEIGQLVSRRNAFAATADLRA